MLEKNDAFYTIYENDISLKNIYNCFFNIDSSIIYVLDSADRFTGVITSKNFFGRQNCTDVNRQCVSITIPDEENVFESAEHLFKKYHITTAIPILDKSGRICYEIRQKRENHDEQFLDNFYDRFRRYEKSKYLNEEIIYLRRILQNQPVTVVGTKERFQHLCGEIFHGTDNITFIQAFEDAYEFMSENEGLLIDVSITNYSARNDLYFFSKNGYHWHKFLDTTIQMIELECFSRFYRVTENPVVTHKDFLEKYSDGRVEISSWGILTEPLKQSLNGSSIRIIEHKGIYRKNSFQYYYIGNGVMIKEPIVGEQLLLEQSDVMLQFLYLNKEFCDQASVINFAFDVEVKIPGENKKRIIRDKLFNLRNYLSDMKESGMESSLYAQKGIRYITELEASFQYYITRRFENDLLVWKDSSSRLANTENGMRKTCFQPEQYAGTVYFFGMCTIYGALVEDSYTIPSIVQKYINQSGLNYRVVNLGNQMPPNAARLKKILNIKKNDIIVILFPFITDNIKRMLPVIEIGEDFNKLWETLFYDKDCFMDAITHCGDYGHILYSQSIYKSLKSYLTDNHEKDLKKNSIYNVFKINKTDLETFYAFDSYIQEIQMERKKIPKGAEKVGCIVMNCNPFTSGHRYLIEYALKNVDYLFIFVVEEDQSVFSFHDRFQMVKNGTSDLKNVSVVRSGRLIISLETFPTYFRKEESIDSKDVSMNIDSRG